MKLAEYKFHKNGPSFFIPENDFLKDSKPVEEEELENGLSDQEKAIAWSEYEYQMQLFEKENN
jgi:hypothetical protein